MPQEEQLKFEKAKKEFDNKKKNLELSEILRIKLAVSSFIGLIIYNKDYIPQLATRLAPLHDLNRNEGKMED